MNCVPFGGPSSERPWIDNRNREARDSRSSSLRFMASIHVQTLEVFPFHERQSAYVDLIPTIAMTTWPES